MGLTPALNQKQAEGTPKKEREAVEAEEGRKAAKMAPKVRNVLVNVRVQLDIAEGQSEHTFYGESSSVFMCFPRRFGSPEFPQKAAAHVVTTIV